MGRRLLDSFRRYFVRGLLAFLPLVLTIWILDWVIRFMDGALYFLPPRLRPQSYLPVDMPGAGAVTTIFLIWGIGVFVTHAATSKARRLWERVLHAIPLVSGIYKSVNQLVDALFSQDRSGFRRVVLVEYPRRGLYSLAFVTGVTVGEVQERTGERVINVFIPTTPNPTSGWYILVPEDELVWLDMSVEDAFKLIISGGMVVPAEASRPAADVPPPLEIPTRSA